MTAATTVEPSAELKAANGEVMVALEMIVAVLKPYRESIRRRYELYVAEFDAVEDDRDWPAVATALGNDEISAALTRVIDSLKEICGGHELP